MAHPEPPAGVGSLIRVNVRRSIVTGRYYLALSSVLTLVISILVLLEAHRDTTLLGTLLRADLPLFAIVGASGGLLVFISDKSKGVYEYLIAYGVDTKAIFTSILLGVLVLVSIVLSVTLGTISAISLAQTGTFPTDLMRQVAAYVLPLAYTGAAFMTMAGITWSALATPRTGVSGPTGIAPLVGVGPVLLVTILAGILGGDTLNWLVGGVSVGMFGIVVVLIGLLARSKGGERFLSTL